MADILRNVSIVAATTMLSRCLGLLRDVLLFAFLGTGAVSSAFILAFTLPNLFRRLLGEGALSSASIPVLTEVRERSGEVAFGRLLNAVLTRLAAVLGLIMVAAWGLLSFVSLYEGFPERVYLGARLTQWLLPYLGFVCLAALVGAALNIQRRFLSPALSPVWLNLAMIAALLLGFTGWVDSMETHVLWLCGGVLLGGALQLLVPGADLFRTGWRPKIVPGSVEGLGKVFQLLIPGLVGAAVFQVNILVSRFLAFSLDDTAAGVLYLAARLVELPLGVFAIAVSTVLFPELARLRTNADARGFAEVYARGLRITFFVTLPAAVGLAVLAGPILQLLFAWGRFGAADVALTRMPLAVAAAGIPFYAWIGLAVRAFHARQDMRTPVGLAVVNLVLNLILSLILMGPFGATGLALANVLASAAHALALEWVLRRREGVMGALGAFTGLRAYASITGVSLLMGSLILAGDIALGGMGLMTDRLGSFVRVVLFIPTGMLFYAGAMWLLRAEDLRMLGHRIRGRRNAKDFLN
ncbi:MAG: murein biosynthesis integral membrane protein MurJ [Opitutales bacterium]|nr:murein biosynthesis integral membrane protein MurJ [Opitutales bacterium]